MEPKHPAFQLELYRNWNVHSTEILVPPFLFSFVHKAQTVKMSMGWELKNKNSPPCQKNSNGIFFLNVQAGKLVPWWSPGCLVDELVGFSS